MRLVVSTFALVVLGALGAGLLLGGGASGQTPACIVNGYSVPCPPTPTATAPPTGTPAPDTRPCALTTRRVAGQRIRTLRTRGLRLSVTTDEACILTARVLVDRATARRLGVNRRARGSVSVGSLVRTVRPGTTTISIRLTSRARRAFARARRVSLSVRAATVDVAGNERALGSFKVSIRR
jgi:hypothetical protein